MIRTGPAGVSPEGVEAGRRKIHRRRNRMIRRSDFDRGFREGRRGRARGLMVVVCDSPIEESRLGLAVSRKVGNAVRRNRARRLLRESFRLQRGDFPRALDIIVIPSHGFPEGLAEASERFAEALRAALNARPRARKPGKKGS